MTVIKKKVTLLKPKLYLKSLNQTKQIRLHKQIYISGIYQEEIQYLLKVTISGYNYLQYIESTNFICIKPTWI